MQGHPKVVEALRRLLKFELTEINQSFLHARMCLDWGYESIAAHIRKNSIANMVFAEQLIDRILFLEGMPSLRDTFQLRIGTDVGQIHANDCALAKRTVDCANEGIEICTQQEDDASRELIESILAKEEGVVEWLEAQLKVIKDASLGLYLARQMRKD